MSKEALDAICFVSALAVFALTVWILFGGKSCCEHCHSHDEEDP
jgi:hypothetical protein